MIPKVCIHAVSLAHEGPRFLIRFRASFVVSEDPLVLEDEPFMNVVRTFPKGTTIQAALMELRRDVIASARLKAAVDDRLEELRQMIDGYILDPNNG